MKYLVTLVILATLIGCGEPAANNAPAAEPGTRLIKYVNNIALSTPGWDNNDVTKNEFSQKLCARFNKDLKDSDLLNGIYFALENLNKESNDGFVVTFKSFKTKALSISNNTHDSTEVNVEVYTTMPDSLAKSVKTGELYYIESYTKEKSDSSYILTPLPSPIMDNYETHTVYACWLGSYHIHIQKFKPIDAEK